MAFVIADRVKEQASFNGTGSAIIVSTAAGFQSFSAGVGVGNTTFYTIVQQGGSEWESGIGTVVSATELSRDTVLESSNADALVSFPIGTKDVFCGLPAKRAAVGAQGFVAHPHTVDTAVAIPDGYNALTGGPISISSGGSVSLPAGSSWTMDPAGLASPAFRVTDSQSSRAMTSGAWTKITLDTENWDTAGCYDTANSRFTPNVAGYYQVNATLAMQASSGGARIVSVWKNGAEVWRGEQTQFSTSDAQYLVVAAQVDMNGSTDYIELYGWQNGTSPVYYGNASYMAGCLARRA